MSMPDELKEAFEVLEKYQFKHHEEGKAWHDFVLGDYHKESFFRLKKDKPLTVDEAMKEQIVYVPNVYIPSIYELLSASYLIISNPKFIQAYAKKSLAYYTSQGATAHAQMWLDMKVEE